VKRLFCATIVVGAFTAVLPAEASDLSVARRSSTTSTAFNWSGPYLGGNLGGAHGETDITQSDALGDIEHGTFSASGVAGGGQAGYNWLLSSNWLVGFEADVVGAGIRATTTTTSAPAFGPEVVNWKERIDAFGTARVRLGLAWDNWLFYGTGGYAWSAVKFTRTQLVEGGLTPPAGFVLESNFPTRSGWAAGGGVEWGIVRNWAARVEYLHLDLGSQSSNFNTANTAGNTVVQFLNRGRVTIDTVRGGVDYLFN
jgi:opacity protein-like surface antigen